MGCNCKKDGIPLSLKQELRRKTKEKIADIKKIWKESSSSGAVTVDKNKLGFK